MPTKNGGNGRTWQQFYLNALIKLRVFYFDVMVKQINYPDLNKQDSIEQVRGWSHKKDLVQVFILSDPKL